MPTFSHQLKLLGVTDRCRVANNVVNFNPLESNEMNYFKILKKKDKKEAG
jgi:hypothetical protein